ncbi:MAG: hypothetical protein AAF152_04740 [Cyanobacteria bacterium P01_A01_bin.114]
MTSSANSAGADASIINLELNTLEQPISDDAQTDAVLDAVVVQAMYEEIPAESRLSSPLLKVLGFSALSGAALSLVTPIMGWQTAKLLPTLGAGDSESASDVDDGIDWVAPPTESEPQVALAETSLPSFVTRSKGPTLSGQARLAPPSPAPQAEIAATPTFSASVSSRPPFDFQAFSSDLQSLAANSTPSKPIEVGLLPVTAPAVSAPVSEAPVLSVPDIDAVPARQGRPVTVQARHQHGKLPTLPSFEPARVAALPHERVATANASEIDKQMPRTIEAVEEPAIEESIIEETSLQASAVDATLRVPSNLVPSTVEELDETAWYSEWHSEETVAIAPDQVTETNFDGAAPVSVVLLPEGVDASTTAASDPNLEARVPDINVPESAGLISTADWFAATLDTERAISADPSSAFVSADTLMSVEELVFNNPELVSTAIADRGELVVPTETGNVLIEALTVDEVFSETEHSEGEALPRQQMLTMRSGQLIAAQIQGEPVLLSVTHLSADTPVVTALAHQHLSQQLDKQTKQGAQ